MVDLLAADSSSEPRLVDGFSLLHVSFGILSGSVLLILGVVWWEALLAVLAVALLWELAESRFSTTIRPLFGLDASEKDSKLNKAGDVGCALAGYGFAVVTPWPTDIAAGVVTLLLGIVWAVCRSRLRPNAGRERV
jgi:hypothetical protein